MTTLRQSFRQLLLSSRLLRDGCHLVATVRAASRPGRSTLETFRSLLAAKGQSPSARALHWVRCNELSTGGIRVHSRHPAAYAEVTGYFIPTLLEWGEFELAVRCAKWLISVQSADGSFADPDRGLPYIFDTGQVLRGLLATMDTVPEGAASAQRAAEYLCQHTLEGGRAGFDVTYPKPIRRVRTSMCCLPCFRLPGCSASHSTLKSAKDVSRTIAIAETPSASKP